MADEHEIPLNPGCLMLDENMADQRDFMVWEVTDLPVTIPSSYSLGMFVATTNYQNGWGSCTSCATSHSLQIDKVKEMTGATAQIPDNVVTMDWKDNWVKMWHDLNNKNDSGDYVENAVKTAVDKGILGSDGKTYKMKAYTYDTFGITDEMIDKMKKTLYKGIPLIFAIQGSSKTWNEMTAGEVKTLIPVKERSGGHCVCCVGYDENGFWFLNSWMANDSAKKKSRFYVSIATMKNIYSMFNWRYFCLIPEDKVVIDVDYLKEKNNMVLVLKALKSIYAGTKFETTKRAIEQFSSSVRSIYPEINTDLPVNS